MALVAFDSERQQLATVSVDGLLAVWDAASSALVQQHAWDLLYTAHVARRGSLQPGPDRMP